MSQIAGFFVKSFLTLISLTGSIVAAGLILEGLKRVTSRYMVSALGLTGIYITAWIGTPIHELGHALMCVIFRHRIVEMKLLTVNEEMTLGHVNHAYNPKSFYQRIGNFFIGIAPILSGTAVIILLMKILLPNELTGIDKCFSSYSWSIASINNIIDNVQDLVKNMFSILFTNDNITSFKFWIFIFIAISVSSHMALSPADMKGALSGVISLYIVVFIINLISFIPAVNTNVVNALGVYNDYLIFALVIAVFCSLCATFLSLILFTIKQVLVN